jgi:hypothetical protein
MGVSPFLAEGLGAPRNLVPTQPHKLVIPFAPRIGNKRFFEIVPENKK